MLAPSAVPGAPPIAVESAPLNETMTREVAEVNVPEASDVPVAARHAQAAPLLFDPAALEIVFQPTPAGIVGAFMFPSRKAKAKTMSPAATPLEIVQEVVPVQEPEKAIAAKAGRGTKRNNAAIRNDARLKFISPHGDVDRASRIGCNVDFVICCYGEERH